MKWIKILAPILVIVLAGAAIGIHHLSLYPDKVDAKHADAHTVVIAPGEGFRTTARHLEDLGLIQSPLKFRLYARFSGLHRKIQAGEFQLYGTMTPRQILATLVEGRVLLYRVTIPEGYTLRQIAQTVSKAGFGDADTFYQLVTNPDIVGKYQLTASSLEG